MSVTLMCLVLIFRFLLLPEVYCLVCCQRQHVHVTTVVAYISSFLLSLSSLDGHQCEGLLCETLEGHARIIFDYVFHGQMLLIMSKEGKNLLKHFGSSEWEEF
jgi:hypothetical protein